MKLYILCLLFFTLCIFTWKISTYKTKKPHTTYFYFVWWVAIFTRGLFPYDKPLLHMALISTRPHLLALQHYNYSNIILLPYALYFPAIQPWSLLEKDWP